jgi:hypothetical protein
LVSAMRTACRHADSSAVSSTSGHCSTEESVPCFRRCRPSTLDAPLGFCSRQRAVRRLPSR